jgi:hypothetical protein
VGRWVDPDEGAREFVELWSAPTADALHRVLVLHQPIRRSADVYEPFALLEKHHDAEPASSVVTATLLLTDRRWRKGVGQLVRRIADATTILDQEQLDLLAHAFLAADEALYWQVPDDWFSDDDIIIDLGAITLEPDDEDADEDRDPVAPGPTVARREVAPPLRRWAAARAASREPAVWATLFARTRELDARSAAAVMSGLLDVIDALEPPVQELLIRKATRWPDQAVRRAGLALVADRDGPEMAVKLAANDPNARVREWAKSLRSTSPTDRRIGAGVEAHATPTEGESTTLF